MDKLSNEGVFTHGIALKPGKPTILGFDQATDTILVGLPGHPAAAMLVFELMVIWLYRQLTGQKEPPKTLARITENVAGGAGRSTCLLLELTEGEDGIYNAEPVLGKSGLMTTLTRADGYTLIHGDKEGLKEGELIQVTLF
jgi:molybdopterin molybdotransferase